MAQEMAWRTRGSLSRGSRRLKPRYWICGAGGIVDLEIGTTGEDGEGVHGEGIDGHVGGAFLELERLGDGIGDHGETDAVEFGRRRSN